MTKLSVNINKVATLRNARVTGVYCMVGMKARFKPVDVLYSGDDFALVRSTLDTAEEVSKTQEQIRLRAGDEVIITAYDLYDGKVIGS